MDSTIAFNPITGRFFTQILVVDSNDRNLLTNPSIQDFRVSITPAITNLIAVRLIKAEITEASGSIGNLIIDNSSIPLGDSFDPVYIYMNGYNAITVANRPAIPFFGRLSAPVEYYSAISSDLEKEPYTYILPNTAASVNEFHVKLFTREGQPFVPVSGTQKIVLTVALHYVR